MSCLPAAGVHERFRVAGDNRCAAAGGLGLTSAPGHLSSFAPARSGTVCAPCEGLLLCHEELTPSKAGKIGSHQDQPHAPAPSMAAHLAGLGQHEAAAGGGGSAGGCCSARVPPPGGYCSGCPGLACCRPAVRTGGPHAAEHFMGPCFADHLVLGADQLIAQAQLSLKQCTARFVAVVRPQL